MEKEINIENTETNNKNEKMTYGERRILKALGELTESVKTASKEYLTAAEACSLVGLSRERLLQLTYRHEIPFYRNGNGKRTYFKRSELEEWMGATRVATDAEIMQDALKRTVQA